jgi:hypothetical protein
MERENAIRELKEFSGTMHLRIYYPNVWEALNTAIKALAQEPCKDTVSRQAVIDLMMQKWGENFSGDAAMQESINAIRDMPSITPQKRKGM